VRLLLAAFIVLLASCGASPTPRVTPELLAAAQSDDAAVGADDLEHGRLVYIGNCASCHALPQPTSYDPPTWRKWMRSMAPKAKLEEVQARDALRYVLAVRAASGR
jgi:mono/diheme cytochrome c family protein